MSMRVTTALFSLMLAAPVFAGADGPQSAPSPAPREQKKAPKDKAAPPAKVYTDEDLKNAGKDGSGTVTFLPELPPGEGTPAEPSHASDESGRSSASSEGGSSEGRRAASEEGTSDEQGWRARADEQREVIKTAQNEIQRLEGELRDLELDRDPNPPDLLDPQRLQKREARKVEARAQLETARAQLETARQAFEDLEREARLAGVPPAWLEER
jgi:hypothetical protein